MIRTLEYILMVLAHIFSSHWGLRGELCILWCCAAKPLPKSMQLARKLTAIGIVVTYEQGTISLACYESCNVHFGCSRLW